MFGMLARRGHQRCHCNEEGFGTLSRQLGNDEGYRSSSVGVSGWFTRWPLTHGPADGSRTSPMVLVEPDSPAMRRARDVVTSGNCQCTP